MSRYYEMTLEVSGIHTSDDQQSVSVIFENMWEAGDCYTDEEIGNIVLTGRSNLCGGESEDEFATRISHEIWRELERYVPITVRATYLEELPYESHERTEDAYQEFLKLPKDAQRSEDESCEGS